MFENLESYVVPLGDCKKKSPSGFPSLDVDCQLMGVYLRLFLSSPRCIFLVPLDAEAFGYALSQNILKYVENFDRNRLPNDMKTIEKGNNSLSDDKYGCLLQLCFSRLVGFWPKELPAVLLSNHIVPVLLINLSNCAARIIRNSSSILSPLFAETLNSSTSSIIAFSWYLKASYSFIPVPLSVAETALNNIDGTVSGHDDDISAISNSCNEVSFKLPLNPIGFGCARLLEASSGVLSDMIFCCLSNILAVSAIVENHSTPCDYLFSKAVILNLNTTSAFLATITLMLAEAAHIERVKYKQLLSDCHEAKVSKSDGSYTFDNQTIGSLDIARKALRVDNNSLLARLVSCCNIKVAKVAPQVTLSAISTLHLLIGMESADDNEPFSSIFSSIDAKVKPPSSLGEILFGMGLPIILLHTATLFLSEKQNITPLLDYSASVSAPDEDSDSQNKLITPIEMNYLPTNRWATHPLYTTDRFINSISPPVEFLPSPHPGHSDCQRGCPDGTPKSLNSSLQRILEKAENSLKSDFVSCFSKVSGNCNTIESEIKHLGTTVARECVELLRLMNILPSPPPNSTSAHVLTNINPSSSPDKTQKATNHEFCPAFPINVSELSTTVLNKPISLLLEQLLTAPMVFLMMTNESLFLSVLNTQVSVRRPLVIWGPDMRSNMLEALKVEEKNYLDILMEPSLSSDRRTNTKEAGIVETPSNEKSSSIDTGNLCNDDLLESIPVEFESKESGNSKDGISLLASGTMRKGLHNHLAGDCSSKICKLEIVYLC